MLLKVRIKLCPKTSLKSYWCPKRHQIAARLAVMMDHDIDKIVGIFAKYFDCEVFATTLLIILHCATIVYVTLII